MRRESDIPQALQEQLFEGPIPGQSLTNDPNNRYPWEGPPQMTSVKEAREKIFFSLTEPERLENIQQLLLNKVPINAIAETLLVGAFRDGKFNPDMIVNLMEPTMIMLMAIAEKSGIRPIIDADDEEYGDEEDYMMPPENPIMANDDTRRVLERRKQLTPPTLNKAAVGRNIEKELDKLDVKKVQESILQKPKPTDSLLSRG